MIGKVTYHQQVSYCGKPRCKKCREGTGHGPYWYAYQTVEGRTTRTYVGKNLPPEALATIEGLQPATPVHQSELEQEHATIRIYTLGQFRLERRSSPSDTEWHTVTESAWQHQRVRALLGCLLSHPGRKLGREQIMDFLWPELDIDMAASRLDRAVYSLRQLFEPTRGKLAASPLLLTEREVLVLADQQQVWVDADAFEHLLSEAQTYDKSDPGKKEQLLEEAMLLYGGDFLPEAQKVEWTRSRRESLQRAWIGLLLELSDRRSERKFYASAIEPLDKLLAVDPANEAGVQRLMMLLSTLDRRGEALRAYRKLAAVLQQEYHISPLPDTRGIYENIRGGKSVAASLTHGDASALSAAEATRTPSRVDSPATIQIGRSQQSPLVGREQELATLRDLVTTTEQATKFKMPGAKKPSVFALDTQRRPQCVLLMGEVGIGKTRLAEEVSRDAKKRNWVVAWSRVYSQEGSIPYRLWTEVLRKAMEQGVWQRQEVSKRSLVFQPLSTLLPDVLQPLLMPVAFSSSLPPEQEQLRLWEAACELLKLISESTPLLIALDDLQWADASSCELLAYLARRVQGYPIVIVGTCRDNELPANHALRPLLTDLQREHAVECIALAPLNDEQIDALVSSIQVPQPLVQRIRTRAAGNPFFAEELARTIAAPDGSLVPVSATGAENGVYQLPDTITAVLDLRLNRLTQLCQRMLSKAAVLGGSFEFNVISAMEATTPDSDEDQVLDLLEEGLKSGMLTEQGTGTKITYEFWHPLLVTHLYEKLSAARRASLHRRAADILQRVYKGREEEEAATITYHLVEGGADAQVIARFAEMAGDRAYALSSYPEAERYYRIVLENISINQGRTSVADEQLHHAYLLERLGDCTRVQGKYEEGRHFYEQALEIHSKQYKIASSNVNEQDTQVLALLWCEIGRTWYDTGNNSQARLCYERGEQVLKEANIVGGSAWANLHFQQGCVYWREGNYEKALHTEQEALSLFEEVLGNQKHNVGSIVRLTSTRRTLAGDPVDLGRTHGLLGVIIASGGQYREGLPHFNMALALYEQYDYQRGIAIACCDLGDLFSRMADYSQAQASLRRSLNIAERIGDVPVMSYVFGNLGILDIRTGNLVEAENEFRRSILLAERIDDPASISLWYTYLASALQEQGKVAEAGAALYRALTIARTIHLTPYIGLALVALGSIRIAQVMAMKIDNKEFVSHHKEINRTLIRAKMTLHHALSLEGMDAETRVEGKLALAQVDVLLGELDAALPQSILTLDEARKIDSMWLVASAQRLLGSIFSAQLQREQACQYFEQALRIFRKNGMNLEYARTLYCYGEMLIQTEDLEPKEHQQGLNFLNEAQKIFVECNASLDLAVVESFLTRHDLVKIK